MSEREKGIRGSDTSMIETFGFSNHFDVVAIGDTPSPTTVPSVGSPTHFAALVRGPY